MRRSFLTSVVTLFVAVLFVLLACGLIYAWYKPDVDVSGIAEVRALLLPETLSTIAPEPQERLFYFVATLMSLPALLIGWWMVNRILAKLPGNVVSAGYWAAYICTLAALVLLAYFAVFSKPLPFNSVGRGTVLIDLIRSWARKGAINWLVCLLWALPLLALLSYLESRFRLGRVFGVLAAIAVGLLLAVIWLVGIFNYDNYPGLPLHFSAAYYAVAQVSNGASLLVDLSNQYGLYPHFLYPLLVFAGSSVLHYSVAMASLNVLSFLAMFLFLRKHLRSRVILVLGFFSIVYYTFFLGRVEYSWDIYIQYTPIRILFPSLLLLLASFYFSSNSRRVYYTTYFVCAFAVLWNFDSGVVTYLSWMLVLCFDALFLPRTPAIFARIAKHVGVGVGVLVASVLVFSTYIFLRSGQLPDFSTFVKYQQIFYQLGFMMTAMPFIHWWNFVALLYGLGLLRSVAAIGTKDDSTRPRIYFLLSILGVGLFSYYQGRSVDPNLLSASYPALILALLFADDLRQQLVPTREAIVPATFLVIIVALMLLPLCDVKHQIVAAQADRGLRSYLDRSKFTGSRDSDIAFMKNFTIPGERIIILADAPNEAVLFSETATRNGIRSPAAAEILTNSDYEEKLSGIANNHTLKLFLDASFKDPAFIKIISENYEMVAGSNGGLQYLNPKPSPRRGRTDPKVE